MWINSLCSLFNFSTSNLFIGGGRECCIENLQFNYIWLNYFIFLNLRESLAFALFWRVFVVLHGVASNLCLRNGWVLMLCEIFGYFWLILVGITWLKSIFFRNECYWKSFEMYENPYSRFEWVRYNNASK